MRTLRLALAIGLVACGGPPPVYRSVISGRITDAATQKPIGAVQVETIPSHASATTGADGTYELSGGLEVGNPYGIRFFKDGYTPKLIDGIVPAQDGTTIADATLSPRVATLVLDTDTVNLGGTAQSAALRIVNGGGRYDPLLWTVSTTSDADWLSVAPLRGAVIDTPNTLTLQANRAVLGDRYGTYETSLELISNGGSKTIHVKLTHEPAVATLEPVPATLAFGDAATDLALELRNTGARRLDWEIQRLPPYLRIGTRTGSIRPGESSRLTVLLSRRTTPAGSQTGEIVFKVGGSTVPVAVPVTFGVPAEAKLVIAPTVLDFGAETDTFDVSVQNDGKLDFDWTTAWPEPGANGTPGDCANFPVISTSVKQGAITAGGGSLVTVHLDRSLMKAGAYAKTLRFSAKTTAGATITEQFVSVLFVVPARGSLGIVMPQVITRPATAASLRKGTIAGGNGEKHWGPCDVAANGRFRWTAQASAPWLTITPSSGFFAPGDVAGERVDPFQVPVVQAELQVDWSAIPNLEGDTTASIVVEGGGARVERSVTARVPPPGIDFDTTSGFARGTPLKLLPTGATAAAFNPFTDELVVYGLVEGDNSGPATLVHGPGGWEDLWTAKGPFYATPQPPTSWGGGAMVYDLARDRFVYVESALKLGTGQPELNTWEFDGNDWTKIVTAHAPPAERKAFALIDDEPRGRVLLYGGATGPTPTKQSWMDLWAYDGTDWVKLAEPLVAGVIKSRLGYDARRDALAIWWDDGIGQSCLRYLNPTTLATIGPACGTAPSPRLTNITETLPYNPRQRSLDAAMGTYILQTIVSDGVVLDAAPTIYDTPPGTTFAYDVVHDRYIWPALCASPGCDRGGGRVNAFFHTRTYSYAPPPAPALRAPSKLVITSETGTFELSNDGAGWGVYRLKPPSWMTVTPRAGGVSERSAKTIGFTINRAGVGVGLHTGTLTIDTSAGALRTTVEVTLP